jgi:peptide/nickel transport system permease protein
MRRGAPGFDPFVVAHPNGAQAHPMLAYSLKRLGVALLVALTVSLITFSMIYISGDPALAIAGEGARQQDVENIRRFYGFDRPIYVQYLDWLWSALHGDLGRSYNLRQPVADVIFQRLPTTMLLGACAITFALVLAIPLGVLAAVKPNSIFDRVSLTLAVIGQAMPSFWFALTLILWFGVYWRLLPITGQDSWWNFVMPSIALGYYVTPAVMRLTRAGMLEVLSSDYIRTARAKGLKPMRVLFKHALRNAIIPVVALAAVQFGFMLGGSIVIETIFQINGLGYLAWESIQRKDLPMMQAIVLVLSIIYVLITFLADMLNAFLDPRIRVA